MIKKYWEGLKKVNLSYLSNSFSLHKSYVMNISSIQKEFRRRAIDESYTRIKKCVDQLNEDQIWLRNNNSTNSIGNLILHLNGNITQYMLTTLGGKEDIRDRPKEFDHSQRIDSIIALSNLEATLKKSIVVIESLQMSDLDKKYQVQCFEDSGFSIIVHVIEHLSYHTGQIALLTKLMLDQDLGFFEGMEL